MNSVRVKVCGITTVPEARSVAALGVDAIGINFVPASPRFVDVALAREIVSALPSFVIVVGDFVDAPEEEVDLIVESVGLDRIQLHGRETPDYCARRRVPVIKAFRTSPEWSVEEARDFEPLPILVDGYQEGLSGGTGRTSNWTVARRLVENGHEVILAGGLGPENVAEAVRVVGPAAVDLNSAVESAPGRKDLDRIARALAALGRPRGDPESERRSS